VQITEVRIKLMDDPQDRLQAFCSITFDGCFVIRDLKIIRGTKGSFVAMPSRKLMDRCRQCGAKNCLRAVHCSQCGAKLPDARAAKDTDGRAKLYADIAHPINSECREMIQDSVLTAYEQELVLASQPGYVCRYDEFGEGEFDDDWPEGNGTIHHRIEPAEPASGPHHHGSGRVERARVAADQIDRLGDDDFGAGIV